MRRRAWRGVNAGACGLLPLTAAAAACSTLAAAAPSLRSWPLLGRQVPALLRQPDRVQALARGEVEQVAVVAVAEGNVGRQLLAGRDIGELLARGRVEGEARRRFAAHGDVEVAIDIDRQPGS